VRRAAALGVSISFLASACQGELRFDELQRDAQAVHDNEIASDGGASAPCPDAGCLEFSGRECASPPLLSTLPRAQHV